jgi:hypothetical protein
MGRPSKPEAEKVRNAGICLAPREIAAVQAITIARRFRSTGDLVRHALAKYPGARGKLQSPRRVAKTRSSNSDQPPGPRTLLPQPA